jgi:hypothetical protein
MTPYRLLASAALLTLCATAHAEHFQFGVSLTGTYSGGGTEGCGPPLFDQPACPRPGSLAAMLSFDTPSSADGTYAIADGFGTVTNFSVDLGFLSAEPLYGAIYLLNGVVSGFVQPGDGTETFSFDWATRAATYSYDFGYHAPNGSFAGTLSAVPELPVALLLLAGLALTTGAGRRHRRAVQSKE